jgi:transcriptional regulator with XRE-family HTH domain
MQVKIDVDMMMIRRNVTKLIGVYCEDKNKNQSELGKLLGLGKSAVSNIKTMNQNVSLETLIRLHKITGYPYAEFLSETQAKPNVTFNTEGTHIRNLNLDKSQYTEQKDNSSDAIVKLLNDSIKDKERYIILQTRAMESLENEIKDLKRQVKKNKSVRWIWHCWPVLKPAN